MYFRAKIAHQAEQNSSIAGPQAAIQAETGLQHSTRKDEKPTVDEDGKDYYPSASATTNNSSSRPHRDDPTHTSELEAIR